MLVFEILAASEILSEGDVERWTPLSDIRIQVGGERIDIAFDRAASELLLHESWELKSSSNLRAERLVRLTEKGRALLKSIVLQD